MVYHALVERLLQSGFPETLKISITAAFQRGVKAVAMLGDYSGGSMEMGNAPGGAGSQDTAIENACYQLLLQLMNAAKEGLVEFPEDILKGMFNTTTTNNPNMCCKHSVFVYQ